MTSSDNKPGLNSFWNDCYESQHTPWNLNAPAPPFIQFLESTDLPVGRMAVLGSGHGHDAALFGEHGLEVTGFDLSELAIEAATQQYGNLATFVLADLFNLPQAYTHQFDYVLEYTCFCAIEPELREAYVNVVYDLLKPKGTFIGVFFTHHNEGGPPYKTTTEEVIRLFSPKFTIETLALSQHSHPKRQGEEHFALFKKR